MPKKAKSKKKKVAKKKKKVSPPRKRRDGTPLRQQDFTVKQVEKALIEARGFTSHAGDILGCTYRTVVNYLHRYPELREVVKEAKERFKDRIEFKLIKKADEGHFESIKFYLKTQARDRGYIETQHNINQDADGNTLADLIASTKKEAEERGEDLYNGHEDK